MALLRPPTDPLHQTCALTWLKTILTNFKTHIISCKEIPLKSSTQFHFSTVELWLRINWDWTLTHVMYCKITTFIWQMKLENGIIFFILTACTSDWSSETFSCITKFLKILNAASVLSLQNVTILTIHNKQTSCLLIKEKIHYRALEVVCSCSLVSTGFPTHSKTKN